VAGNTVILLTRAIPERIRGGLRRCTIQIDVYFTLPALATINPMLPSTYIYQI